MRNIAMAALVACIQSGAWAQCLSDADLARIANAGKLVLEGNQYAVTTQGLAGPFDFSFAPANYSGSGVNPSSRYVVPRLGPWREGDIGGDSFLNWGIGEVDTMTSRQALVVVMCTPPPVRLWSLETAILYRLNSTANLQPGASISNTENSASIPAAKQDTPLLVIMTPDKSTAAAVKTAFTLPGTHLTVATIVINGTSSLLNFGTKPVIQGCDIFQLCMRIHASPAQAATPTFQSYLDRRFPLLMIEPSFPGADQPLYPVQNRPMRRGCVAFCFLCVVGAVVLLMAAAVCLWCAATAARSAALQDGVVSHLARKPQLQIW
jgi:hypothetical protein